MRERRSELVNFLANKTLNIFKMSKCQVVDRVVKNRSSPSFYVSLLVHKRYCWTNIWCFFSRGLQCLKPNFRMGWSCLRYNSRWSTRQNFSIFSMYTLSYCGYKGSECHFVCTFTTELSKFDIKSKTIRLLQSEVKIHDWDIYLLVLTRLTPDQAHVIICRMVSKRKLFLTTLFEFS